MPRLRCATTAIALLLAASGMSAQQAPHFFGQALLASAVRTVTTKPAGAIAGVRVAVRGGLLIQPHLGIVGEVSLATFPDERVLGVCPVGLPCLPAFRQVPGVGVVALAVGVQPRFHAGPLELLLTATGGGYWLYHHPSDLPTTAPGVHVALAAGLPITTRLHILLEASATHLLRSGVGEANSHHFGVGMEVN
jgi:hypothetical protein